MSNDLAGLDAAIRDTLPTFASDVFPSGWLGKELDCVNLIVHGSL